MTRSYGPGHIVPLLAVVFILSSVLLFGPASPLVEPTPQSEQGVALATGNASVQIVTPPPSSLELRQARYTDSYYVLGIPKTVVMVSEVSGGPLLTYKVEITELGHSLSTIAELSPETEGELALSPNSISISSARVENETYNAELSLTLRASQKIVLYRDNVTVNIS